jgi:basic membrane protein A
MICRNLFVLAALLAFVFALDAQAVEADVKQPIKVGFIYVGSASDLGWNNAHDQGRQYLEAAMPGQVITTRVENVPENSDAERVMEKLIAQGNKVIFATAYGQLEPELRVASRHPEVYFMHCGRPVPSLKNVGSYFGPYYEPFYVAGMLAGTMSKTGNVGYVGAHPIPALLWCINALTLGARSVNPNVKVHVVWTNSWLDPAMEAEASRGLLERGNDVLASNLDTSIVVAKTAEKAKAYAVGANYDINQYVPNSWLTGQSWNWGPLYVKIVQSIQEHRFKPGNLRYSLKDGYVALASFGRSVPKPLQADASRLMASIKNGEPVFKPGLTDRDGKVRLTSGQHPTEEWLDKMDWFVEGVDGQLPKKLN